MEGGMEFIQPKDKPPAGLDAKVERTAVQAARRKFSPEWQVHKRVLDSATGRFQFRITGEAESFCWKKGPTRGMERGI
jgi:hypothetical protein